MPELEKLNLNTNLLSGEVPDFTRLPGLLNLVLNDNALTGKITDFSHLTNLLPVNYKTINSRAKHQG
ncbi:MAG: hypothetical protein ABIR66_00820 [Saprospiraceae bacterium]